MIDFTTVVAVDDEHLRELRWTWPTWVRNRPEMLAAPLLLIYDGDDGGRDWERDLQFVEHPQKRLVSWSQPDVSQREKMLTALTLVPGVQITTPWYLKLDTDAIAVAPSQWIEEEWFSAGSDGRVPAFVTSAWGYSKPADIIQRLDDWADSVATLSTRPRLNIIPRTGATLVRHKRIISWCFFGNTAWTREVTSYCSGRLPVPSQDTYLWYCATRRGDFFRTVALGRLGWQHTHRRGRLRALCRAALQPADTAGSPTQPH